MVLGLTVGARGVGRKREVDHAVRRRWREHTPVVDVGFKPGTRSLLAETGRGKMDDDEGRRIEITLEH